MAKRWIVLLLFVIAGTGTATAQIEMPQGKWWKNNPGLVRALGLTTQQVDQIEGIFQRYRKPLLDLQLDLKRKSLDLEGMLEADFIDASRIEAQVVQVEQARSELATQRLLMIVKIRGQLRPEQWRTLRDIYAGRQGPPRLPRQIRPLLPGRPPGD